MQVTFNIVRQTRNAAPRIQQYTLEAQPGNTILDCLNRIKWEQDGSLAFRKNCRNTICGSCGMRINGRSALACKENLAREIERLQAIQKQQGMTVAEIPAITVAPMGNMPVVKDLVVDMSGFWDGLEAIDPYVSTGARQVPEREFLQSPEDRARLNQMGNCILCGACYSECNAREVNAEFVGPHALAKAYRMVADSRDAETEHRIDTYDRDTSGVWGCTRCYYCNSVCPMDVAPMDQIGKIKEEILERRDDTSSQPVRHRKLLLDLVKEGGWINERKFATNLYTHSLSGLKKLVSLGPLGLKMLVRGKMPLDFDPSEGKDEVRSLIESIRALKP
ncbi:MAG: succinate dehydrogenase/fumarate reductase iron-sulfur subunit [Coleofasciculaceae cyanobacterium SM2_3_26]|nr:succinate dehydrogenase/fumarate reductase iron-sulfur subunit [Coleofasciculaceae cyanobacterium SM2_3_26]